MTTREKEPSTMNEPSTPKTAPRTPFPVSTEKCSPNASEFSSSKSRLSVMIRAPLSIWTLKPKSSLSPVWPASSTAISYLPVS